MGLFIFVVIAGVIAYNMFKSAKTKQEQWRVAAEHLGLEYHSADFGLSGTISGRKGGHRIVVSSFSKGGGNSSNTFTKYRIDYNERIPVDFKITRQNALHKMGHAFGLQDIETGNPAFDDRALVRGMHPHQVQKYLTPDRQTVITNLLTAHSDVMVSNDSIELNKPGKEKDAGILIRTVSFLLAVCNDLTDRQAPIAKKEERVIEIEPVEPSLNPFISANPVVPDPPMVEVAEEPVRVEEVDEPITESPEPPKVDVEEDLEEPETESPELPSAVAATEPLPVPSSFDVMAIAQDLYGVGSKIQPRFEDAYLDQQASGTGILLRVSNFSYDLVFKDRKGVKATCEICEVAGAYSKIKVNADVVFPSERYDDLKNKIGSPISITGKLIAENSIMHILYIISE
jgi:hypothetical protein